MLFLSLIGIFVLSVFLTMVLRRYAIKKSIVDIPNDRSSHTIPTPRGGGVAIVIAFFLVLASLLVLEIGNFGNVLGLLLSGFAIALVGFLDDHGHIAARWRLVAHFSCAALILICIPELPKLALAGHLIDLGWAGYVLSAFYMVWVLNLYNFMDGIDGIASVQAITTCLIAAWLMYMTGLGHESWLPLFLAAAVAGFLVWNFPPARIFMGDAGSGFLGLMIAAMSLQVAITEPRLLWAWVILMGVFIVDATFTLFRRLLRGDKIYEAHRSHAYQYASREFGGHKPITLAVLTINLLWLGPLAYIAAKGMLDPGLALLIAYTPLVLLAIRFHAGKKEISV